MSRWGLGSSWLNVSQNPSVSNAAPLQVKFMKRVAEMSDLTQVIRTLPRIKRHLFNPENMRWAQICAGPRLRVARLFTGRARLFQVCRQCHARENG